MNLEELDSIIRNPELLKDINAADLKSLQNLYPWYSLPAIMLAKQAQLNQSEDFQELLSDAATRIPDRKQLYYIIEQGFPKVDIEENLNQDIEEIEKEAVMAEETNEEVQNQENQKPVFEYVPYEMELQQAIQELEVSGEAATLPNMPKIESDEITLDTSGTNSFMNWLHLVEGEDKVQLVNASAARKPIKLLRQDPVVKGFDEVEDVDFTEADARYLAKQSLELGDDLISATYASILVEQGKVEKAIEVYKKLGLKYPEKISYFAGLILELNKH